MPVLVLMSSAVGRANALGTIAKGGVIEGWCLQGERRSTEVEHTDAIVQLNSDCSPFRVREHDRTVPRSVVEEDLELHGINVAD